MDLFTFRKLVMSTAEYEGQPYLKATDRLDLDDLINRQLERYCLLTGCLVSDEVVFTPQVGERTYDLKDTGVFSKRIAQLRQVFIEGEPLTEFGGTRAGESSEEEAAQEGGRYLTAANARPTYFFVQPPTTLRFNCPFDQVYTDCYVSGVLLCDELITDMQELDLASLDIEPAARLVASALLFPHSREAAAQLETVALRGAEQQAANYTQMSDGPSVRGRKRTSTYNLR